jgi:hypothetical protein
VGEILAFRQPSLDAPTTSIMKGRGSSPLLSFKMPRVTILLVRTRRKDGVPFKINIISTR